MLSAMGVSAQHSAEKIIPMDGRVAPDGMSVELSWFDAKPPRVGSVTVKRRVYGQTGSMTWQPLASGLEPVMRYEDTTTKLGVAYEYQVQRLARDIVDVGYWLSGVEIPAKERRGTAHLVIDTTLVKSLAPHLERFEWDLVGDGWDIQRYSAPRGQHGYSMAQLQEADQIKQALRRAYIEDPFGHHAVILIGHVPIVYSGRSNPDGHDPVPHPTDLFYADMDGSWQARPNGVLAHNNLPGGFIEMQIGRIDFSSLSNGNKNMELRFLRAYFDKNHHWRQGFLGDLRMAYANSGHLAVDRAGMRNVVGPAAIRKGGHHDIGEDQPWLWGIDSGHHSGTRYAETKAVFALNFGSGKQRFNLYRNPMVALLSQPWYTVAVGWGGRPAWWPHHMALGSSIGEVHLRTVNNGIATQPYRESMDYFPTGSYLWRNPVWVNLLGDPTARAFPLSPPEDVVAVRQNQKTVVSWQASADIEVIGYKVYRAPKDSQAFTPLSAEPVAQTHFIDTDPQEGTWYMVRAYGLKQVYAGSFYTFSQGRFSTDTSLPAAEADMTLTAVASQPITLPQVFSDRAAGPFYAPIRAPMQGHLSWEDKNWVYTPPDGFIGQVALDFSVSNGAQTQLRRLSISVGE